MQFKLIPSETNVGKPAEECRYLLCINEEGKVSYCGPYKLDLVMETLNEIINEKSS